MDMFNFQDKCVNPFMSSGLFYHDTLNRSISNNRMCGLFLLLLCYIEFPLLHANSLDPDQMPYSVASDQGLHCQLPFWGFPDMG